MPREAELSLNERAFILQALQENIRLDDRAFHAFRPLKITFGEDYGTADIQLGKTRYTPPSSPTNYAPKAGPAMASNPDKIAFDFPDISCRALARVTASVTAPYPDRKFDGIFTVTTELSPLASPAFEAGR